MFVLGHLGMGAWLARPWWRRLRPRAFFVGALLPDLVDKPLYYGATWLTGKHGAELGWLSGTRTVGHTLLLTLAVAAFARARRSVVAGSIAAGMLTHLFLDVVSDVLNTWADPVRADVPGWAAMVWPLVHGRFPVAPFVSVAGHAEHLMNPVTLGGELLGALGLTALWLVARRPAA